MKIFDLLEEIEEVVNTAPSVPLAGKIIVDPDELLELVKEIRLDLPEEIQQAQWIKGERERILSEAKIEYEKIIKEAERQAETLIENDDITLKAKQRADEIIRVTENNACELKMSSYNYVDSVLYNLQEKLDQLNGEHIMKMMESIETTFIEINEKLYQNRKEIEELACKVQAENE